MTADPDLIADLVLRRFRELPAKRKPQVRDNGLHEWVPLSAIVTEEDGVLTCISLATGMKCLPAAKLPQAQGNALHDWHAEVLAIRAFNRHLLDECLLPEEASSSSPRPPPLLRRRSPHERSSTPQPFAIRDGVKLHMYCSEAPCGDASMELTMAAQDDASPWAVPSSTSPDKEDSSPAATLPGRAYFSQLGVVRRKPARGDAPPTMSKSCSDKLALRQCTSLLSSLSALLVHPGNAYLSTLILPASQRSVSGCERAFSARGRMKGLEGRVWEGGYAFTPFEVRTTDREFEFSRREAAKAGKVAASNLAAVWTASGVEEGSMGGVLQGRRAFDPRGASAMARRRMWEVAVAVAEDFGDEALLDALRAGTYAEVKQGPMLAARRAVKEDAREALAGWVANVGDDGFGLSKK
ncbi:tRNA-specific adenosine deaminase [Colletotrichum plurivorum]|uniref:tRNA-specific adenosine deaminase n=1 Tax=Colletotrichum plurivorum TaxID=2175906 RepID=A0A8H6K942_9PEZI|nr:tRNA-specific adenosine deaminase [Colletotrichum plurivorum]